MTPLPLTPSQWVVIAAVLLVTGAAVVVWFCCRLSAMIGNGVKPPCDPRK
jgi:hypothetical protein